jgi:hypothetical protein
MKVTESDYFVQHSAEALTDQADVGYELHSSQHSSAASSKQPGAL